MEPKQLAHLYLLVFPLKNVVKVGKANDIQSRLSALKRWWGEPDFDASYYMAAEESKVRRIEKALHCFLDKYEAAEEVGDGRTELFQLDALPIALQHLEMYNAGRPEGSYQVVKGIPTVLSGPKLKHSKADIAYQRFRKKGGRMLASLEGCIENLKYLERIVALLLKWQHRIPYQWERIDDQVFFRMCGQPRKVANSIRLWQSFSYRFEDFGRGFHGINLCSTTGEDDVIQFEINLGLLLKRDQHPDLLEQLLLQASTWIDELPQRSAAVVEDIPILKVSFSDFSDQAALRSE